MPDDATRLRNAAQRAILTGTLRREQWLHLWGQPGDDTACAVCGEDPGHNDAGENEGDRVVGYLVALAQDLGSPVAAMHRGGECPPPTAETCGNGRFLTRQGMFGPQGYAERGRRAPAL